jgi:ABC-2 type transport system permease protein
MRKILTIGFKDLITTFRDPSALILALVTPIALTLAMAFAFGGFGGGGGGGTGLSHIPVVVVNQDRGELGRHLVELLTSSDLDELLDPVEEKDPAAARSVVDAGEAAAAVIVPADLTERVIPSGSGGSEAPVAGYPVEIYANPTAPISVGVVRSLVEGFSGQVNATTASVEVAITQLVQSGRLPPQQTAAMAPRLAQTAAAKLGQLDLVRLAVQEAAGNGGTGFNWMAYMAPSMAVLFMMFTVTAGGRSILGERDAGTLARLLTTPSSSAQVLAGKVVGTYLTGLAQMGILIAASTILFGVGWGSPLAVAVVLLALVAAATGWGTAIAAFARTSSQADVAGTAVTLVFGIMAGHFFPRELLPSWLRTLSFVSPNAWGLEAFYELAAGGGLADVAAGVAALTMMAALAFGVAVVLFRRQLTR